MSDFSMVDVGKNIRQVRKAKGMTQFQTAESVDCCLDSVRKWERGEQEIGACLLRRLADCLGCSADYLLGRSAEE